MSRRGQRDLDSVAGWPLQPSDNRSRDQWRGLMLNDGARLSHPWLMPQDQRHNSAQPIRTSRLRIQTDAAVGRLKDILGRLLAPASSAPGRARRDRPASLPSKRDRCRGAPANRGNRPRIRPGARKCRRASARHGRRHRDWCCGKPRICGRAAPRAGEPAGAERDLSRGRPMRAGVVGGPPSIVRRARVELSPAFAGPGNPAKSPTGDGAAERLIVAFWQPDHALRWNAADGRLPSFIILEHHSLPSGGPRLDFRGGMLC